jgi:membrane protease subunit (stomatin/prohibitin family)
MKFVGTMPGFDRDRLTSYFKGIITARVKDLIANAVVKDGVSFLEISAHLNSISARIQQQVSLELEEFGVSLIKFVVTSINTPEDDPAVSKLKAALAKRAEMNIVGFTYQQERTFDTLQTAAGNEGTAGGVMGVGMGLGMGVGFGAPMGMAMGQMAQNLQTQSQQAPNPSGQAPCPKCAKPNAIGTKFCTDCGSPLAAPGSSCGKCGHSVAAGAKFCPNCGNPMIRKCGNCQNELAAGAKFCANCGQPAT